MFEQVNGSKLIGPLSKLFSAPDYNRPMTIMKQQCRQLLLEQMMGFCGQELFAQSRVWLALYRHTENAWEEFQAGQLRCALELDLFLWELTRILTEACLRSQPSFPTLLARQEALLHKISLAQGFEKTEYYRRLSGQGESSPSLEAVGLSEDLCPEERLFAGDDSLLEQVKMSPTGPILEHQGQIRPLLLNQAPNFWAYARVLLLARQTEALYAFLLAQPELLPEFEAYFLLFTPEQALTLQISELRQLADTSKSVTEYAHIFNVLVGWVNGEHRSLAAELLPELIGRTARSELKTMLNRLVVYEKTLDAGPAETTTL